VPCAWCGHEHSGYPYECLSAFHGCNTTYVELAAQRILLVADQALTTEKQNRACPRRVNVPLGHAAVVSDSPSAEEARRVTDWVGVSDSIQISISYALWAQWGEIAIEREGRARAARARLVAQHRHGQEIGPEFAAEFLAGLVAVSAAAHALDALYGQLVTDDIKTAGPKGDAGREAHIRECLKRRFRTGKRDAHWVDEFGWLFRLRDAAVHAREQLLASVPHPSGVTNSGQMSADYSAEAAIRAVDLLVDVLTTCVANPKPQDREARKWTTNYGPSVQTMVTDLRVSRDAQPLVRAGSSTD
jgi:hypothetical protein